MAETLPDINIDIQVIDRDYAVLVISTDLMQARACIPIASFPHITEALKQARALSLEKLVTPKGPNNEHS
jgi:hypothetical protein